MASSNIIIFFSFLSFSFNFYCLDCRKFGKNGEAMKVEDAAIKIVKTVYGDEYNCIDIYKQPGFDHPAASNHKIEMEFVKELEAQLQGELKSKKSYNTLFDPKKLWLDGGCTEGTVPIRRMTKALKERAFFDNQTPVNRSLALNNGRQDFAGIITTFRQGVKYHGASAQINIYNPKLFGDDQSSAALMGIGTGTFLYSIQVGWTVYPGLYGDSLTRLFTFWGANGNGCFNDGCPGFVHVNTGIPVDFVFPDISKIDGQQFDSIFGLTLVPGVGWYFYLSGTSIVIGYWPNYLFGDNLASGVDVAWWGGLVTSTSNVSPQMGSGLFKNGEYQQTAYMRQVKVVDQSDTTFDPDDSFIAGGDSRCYFEGDHSPSSDPYWGYKFLFGGAGGKDGWDCVY